MKHAHRGLTYHICEEELKPRPSRSIPWSFSDRSEEVWRASLPGGSVNKKFPLQFRRVSAMQKNQETWIWTLGQEDPLEKGMAPHSSIPVWRIPWAERGQRSLLGYSWVEKVEYDLVTKPPLPPRRSELYSPCEKKSNKLKVPQ